MPTFTFKSVDCVSAGIIFYRARTGAIEFLMQQKIDRKTRVMYYEDLGGKSSYEDSSIEDVAAREAAEESNGQIVDYYDPTLDYQSCIVKSKNYILDLLKKNSIVMLQRKTKYALFIVFLPETRDYDFGGKELHPKWDIDRTVNWVSPKKVFKEAKSIHPRIRHLLRFF